MGKVHDPVEETSDELLLRIRDKLEVATFAEIIPQIEYLFKCIEEKDDEIVYGDLWYSAHYIDHHE